MAEPARGAHTERGGEGGEEVDRDIPAARLVGSAAGLVGLVVAAAIVCWLLYGAWRRSLAEEDPTPSPLPGAQSRWVPPEPRLQEDPRADMARLRERESAILHGYGWADEQAATGHVPIARAIELMADKVLRPALSQGELEPAPALTGDAGASGLGSGDVGLGRDGILDIGARGRDGAGKGGEQ